jgi:signal transduction histidine kinase
MVPVNIQLFGWVLENLIRNSVDAMSGEGKMSLELSENRKEVYIDITDTGKGIARKHFKSIFTPGFTTKKRGWGLGLTLAKRIITNYHKGKIFVKSSALNQGTTIRIVLKRG